MLYYATWGREAALLYRSGHEAIQLLTRCTCRWEAHGISIVDYLLLPTSFEALVYSTFSLPHWAEVPNSLVLKVLAHLGRVGSQWPFCGFYELFNRSLCYAKLGKSGCNLVPYPLSAIIEAKLQAQAVLGDEIA